MREAQAKKAAEKLAADRTAARPKLRQWHEAIDGAVRQRRVRDFDYRLALHLADYPSANNGRCWPGLDRLAEHFGRNEVTIRRSLGRLIGNGFLRADRRGLGRTNTYTFLIDGKELFAIEKPPIERKVLAFADVQKSTPDGAELQDQERAAEHDKPLESYPSEESIPLPLHDPRGGVPAGTPGNMELPATQRTPTRISFNDFYGACRDKRGNDLWGPAFAEWQKLTEADKVAIGDHIDRNGGIYLNGSWAVTWLKARKWRDVPEPAAPAAQTIFELYPDKIFVEEGTPEWHERVQDCLQFGGANGLRVQPRAYEIGGKRGRFFLRERPQMPEGLL